MQGKSGSFLFAGFAGAGEEVEGEEFHLSCLLFASLFVLFVCGIGWMCMLVLFGW